MRPTVMTMMPNAIDYQTDSHNHNAQQYIHQSRSVSLQINVVILYKVLLLTKVYVTNRSIYLSDPLIKLHNQFSVVDTA